MVPGLAHVDVVLRHRMTILHGRIAGLGRLVIAPGALRATRLLFLQEPLQYRMPVTLGRVLLGA